jgi:hypothetical protein
MRVAEDPPPNRSRRAGPRFEPGRAMVNRPADETVDGCARIRTHESIAREFDDDGAAG